jgi:hypothetical protein
MLYTVGKKDKTILKPVCVTGFILVALCLGLTLWLHLRGGTRRENMPSDFYKTLNLFDVVLQRGEEEGGVNHTHIANLLEALSKSAIGAESRLSVLKRYRNLSRLYPEYYFSGYSDAASRAAKKFPHSALIAALSAEADLYSEMTSDKDAHGTAEKIRAAAALLVENGLISGQAFFPAAFCLYALNGDFHDIDSASAIKQAGELFTAFSNSLPVQNTDNTTERVREAMYVDAALIGIVDGGGNRAAALARLEPRKVVLTKTLDFMANYAYDFSNPLLAAELWSRMGTEEDFARAASALYVAGDTENAKKLWLLLIKDQQGVETASTETAQRSLYNLASIAVTKGEKIAYAEQLLSGIEYGAANRDVFTAAVILYTRLMPTERALNVLSMFKLEPLLGLEYQRRTLEAMPLDRSIAETWLLLNRHPYAEDLYVWAAWYFEYQRRYGELDALLHFAAQNKIENPVLTFHYALEFLRDGDMSAAEDLLMNGDTTLLWQRYANTALILDACHRYPVALKYYEDAAALIPDDAALYPEAARIYLKLARCRDILGGKPEEIRRDLERAYAFDRENIDVRLALRRL